jgi:hypothetical protein
VAAGQRDNTSRCRAALIARRVADSVIHDPCFDLAGLIVLEAGDQALLGRRAGALPASGVAPRDVQSTGGAIAAPSGSPAQSSAVPTVQPTPLASATVAAVAQDSGSSAITAVSINPAMLFSSTEDPAKAALLSRLLDVTVFFPVNDLDQNDDGRLDYGGIRVRVNLTAPAQTGGFERKFRDLVQSELGLATQIEVALRSTADPAACADRLQEAGADLSAVEAACATRLVPQLDEAKYLELRHAAARAREEADAKYFGLDLRFDTGDPTLGKVRHAAGTAIVAGLGFGRRFSPSSTGATAGLRGRLGARYVNLRDTTLVDWQLDGGVGIEASRLIESQRLELSAGFEFRFSGNRTAAEILRTRYAEFRAGISVPLAGSASIAVSVSAPLMGEISPTLSVGGNWQQLLAAAVGRR